MHACEHLGVSERRACRVLGQARSAQRHRPRVSADEARLVARIIELARENGFVESFNGKLRDELLDREIFFTLGEAKASIGQWRQHYNRIRPHGSFGYRPPASEAIRIGPPRPIPQTPTMALGLT